MYSGKLTSLNGEGALVDHDYGDIFFRQPMEWGERLVIGPSNNQVEIMLSLAQTWDSYQFYILYVLLVSHSGAEPGRYQSPLIESLPELQSFFETYASFFEHDGRHHIWIGSPLNEGLLVFDQHNVIFAYGNLARYERLLVEKEFSQHEFWFPGPHGHGYPPNNVQHEEKLLRHFSWQYSPLQDGDEWE